MQTFFIAWSLSSSWTICIFSSSWLISCYLSILITINYCRSRISWSLMIIFSYYRLVLICLLNDSGFRFWHIYFLISRSMPSSIGSSTIFSPINSYSILYYLLILIQIYCIQVIMGGILINRINLNSWISSYSTSYGDIFIIRWIRISFSVLFSFQIWLFSHCWIFRRCKILIKWIKILGR